MQRAFALQPAAAWRWSLLACLVFGAATPVQAAIPPAESQALVDLYNATGGASWTNRTNWITAVGAECTWFGVTCDAGQTHVVELQLSNNHLDGVLPALGGLSQLQTLDLSRNAVTGVGGALAGLTELRQVALMLITDSGALPVLATFPHLVSFRATSSQFTGALPDFSGLQDLQVMDVSGNDLSGVPPALTNLP